MTWHKNICKRVIDYLTLAESILKAKIFVLKLYISCFASLAYNLGGGGRENARQNSGQTVGEIWEQK